MSSVTTVRSTKKLKLIDLFCLRQKFLVYNIILRNLKLRYHKSFFGVLWTVIIPAANALVYFVVFHFVMRVKIPNYLAFLLTGLLPWTFFQSSILQGVDCIRQSHKILNKVPIPPYAFPLAETLTVAINFFASIPVLIIVYLLSGVHIYWSVLLTPFMFLMLLIQGFGWGLVLGYGQIFFRDLRHMTMIAMQIWFYVTPVIYKGEMIPAEYSFALQLNPIGGIFQVFHSVMTGDPFTSADILSAVFWTVLSMLAALIVSRRYSSTIVEMV